jgi:hypothetical protein
MMVTVRPENSGAGCARVGAAKVENATMAMAAWSHPETTDIWRFLPAIAADDFMIVAAAIQRGLILRHLQPSSSTIW